MREFGAGAPNRGKAVDEIRNLLRYGISCEAIVWNHHEVISLNNDKDNMEVRRILSLYDQNGKKRNLIPIEKYPDIPKESGIEKRTFRKTLSGKPIQEKYLQKTKTRLNKWDRKKMYYK